MTYDGPLFNTIWELEEGMSVEFGDDATYPMRGVGSIFFQIFLDNIYFC